VATLVPLVFVLYTVVAKGIKAISWSFLTSGPIPANVGAPGCGGRHGAALIGTLEITGFAALMPYRLGVLGAIYINEYGGKGWLARLHRVHGGRDDRRTVDRDGALFIFRSGVLHFGYSGLAGSFDPGLPDAAHRDPLDL